MKILYYLLLILIIVYLVDCAALDSNSKERKARKNKKSEDQKSKNEKSEDRKSKNENSKERKGPKNEKSEARKIKQAKNSKNNEEKQEEQFKKQLKSLFKLGCKPTKCKVSVRSLLGSESHIHDFAHVYPEFVVIKKCNESCSFCKFTGDDLGVENSVCKPNKTKTKKIVVKFRNENVNEWRYKGVKTMEDKKCECSSKDDFFTGTIPPDEKVVASPMEPASNVPPLSISKNR